MTRSTVMLLTLVVVLATVGVCQAQTGEPETSQPPTIERRWTGTGFVDAPAGTEAAPAAGKPMVVNGTAVNVRGGPGMYYYELLKLEDGATVQALGSSGGWTYIQPPQSVVALVKKGDVLTSESGARVTAATARVYARDPGGNCTWAVIAQLPLDETVTIKGEHDGFYEINTPSGAKVCVKGQYLSEPRTENTTTNTDTSSDNTLRIDTSKVELREIHIDAQADALTAARDLLKGEMAKPLAERRWDEVEAALNDVVEKASTQYVKSAAQQSLSAIEFQKSLQAMNAKLDSDNEKLKEQLDEIRRNAEQREAERMGKASDRMAASYDFEGTLRKMTAKMAYAYRLEGDQGGYVCLLNGNASLMDPLLGRKVRVWGDKRFRVDLDMNVCEVQRIEPAPAVAP
ncbi:MAG: hypothetical protein JXL80_06815 [Planctomycetes bacterium]|nr:hypothetical protein [Planctomycetota bacterium]